MPSITGCPGVVVKSVTGSVDDTALSTIGSRSYGSSGDEYVYLGGLLGVVAGSVVTYDAATGVVTLAAPNAIGPVGVATAPIVAGKFGWYCVKSPAAGLSVAVDAGILVGAKVYIGSAGKFNDTVVAGDQVVPAVFRSVDTAGFALAAFDYPYASDSLG